jgi:hypothetical protein
VLIDHEEKNVEEKSEPTYIVSLPIPFQEALRLAFLAGVLHTTPIDGPARGHLTQALELECARWGADFTKVLDDTRDFAAEFFRRSE